MTTILIVDDDPKLRAFLDDTLRFGGYNTLMAADGYAGINLASKHIPDLIISDINMPHFNGYQMLEDVRNTPRLSNIPVIFLTAESHYSEMRKGMTGGAEDYLIKPVTPQDVLAAVKVQLDKRATLDEQHHKTLRLLRKKIIYALPHELHTPLQAILGYAQLLQMDNGATPPEAVLEYAGYIAEAGSRLQRLIENYLIFAQLELIHLDADATAAAHNHIVKDSEPIITKAAQDIATRHDRLDDLQIHLTHQALRISETDLAKIMLELIDNAFKFSPPGLPIVVQSRRHEDLLYIWVRDEGCGMSEEEVAQMDAYMQFGRELYEQQGIGLGFAVAKRLVELHNGAIKIDTLPNQGTVVTVRFPLF